MSEPGTQARVEAGGAKPKTAKELKKEKRAAAVAARGTTDSPAVPEGAAPVKGRPNALSGGTSQPSSSLNVPTMGGLPRRPGHVSQHSQIGDLTHSSQTQFFSHLPGHNPPDTPLAFNGTKLHPEVIRLGVLMSEGTLRGANARTMAMMAAFQEVIRDYECPDQAVLWKDLPIYLSPMIAWLEGCRPKGVAGGNAIRWLKGEINRQGETGGKTDAELKEHFIQAIDDYIRDRIEYAGAVIADFAKEKIKPGDVVVTYARSSVVEQALLGSWREMREDDSDASFEVIVVDSRPLLEGRSLLKSLTAAGLPCTYVLLPLLSSVLPRVDLVLLGAAALHSDGALFSRSGTAMVSMLAKEHRVPVVVCVETYKFGERVVLDGVASNELGNTEIISEITSNKALGVKKPLPPSMTPLSLMYDLTPANLITAVCTEIGFIPPSSVPTVLGKASGVA